MSEPIIASSSRSSEAGAPTPIHCLYESELAAFVEARPSFVKGFVALADFKAKAGQVLVLPTPQGVVDRVLLGLGQKGKAEATLFHLRWLEANADVAEGAHTHDLSVREMEIGRAHV